MAISRSNFEDFLPEQVHEFVCVRRLLDKEEAAKLLKNKVDGYALLHSSEDEVKREYGLLPGPAKSLVGRLMQMFPGQDFLEYFQMCMVFVCLCISTRMPASFLKHLSLHAFSPEYVHQGCVHFCFPCTTQSWPSDIWTSSRVLSLLMSECAATVLDPFSVCSWCLICFLSLHVAMVLVCFPPGMLGTVFIDVKVYFLTQASQIKNYPDLAQPLAHTISMPKHCIFKALSAFHHKHPSTNHSK